LKARELAANLVQQGRQASLS